MARNYQQSTYQTPDRYPSLSDYVDELRRNAGSNQRISDDARALSASQPEHLFANAQSARNWTYYSQDAHPTGLGIHYPGYDSNAGSFYVPSEVGSPGATMPASPSTPQSLTTSDAGSSRLNRRAGNRANPSTVQKSRVAKSPKLRKVKAARNDHKKKLTEPLSVLTRHLTEIPVKDMEAWVNRSEEERRQEVIKKKGYIARPMNSFMLYRSAYSERTKAWCSENNHQVVSAVSGESWPLESPEIREKYNELAKIERTNHQKTHPEYKFSPSKAGLVEKKKKSDSLEVDVDANELDPDWKHSGYRRAATPSGTDVSQVAGNTTGATPQYIPASALGTAANLWRIPGGGLHSSHLSQQAMYSHYTHGTVHQSHRNETQNVVPRPGTSHSNPSIDQEPSLLGLPGGQHPDLFQIAPNDQNVEHMEGQVDPNLLTYGYHNEPVLGNEVRFRPVIYGSSEGETSSVYLPQYEESEFHPDPWRNDTAMPFEPTSEFDNWMDSVR